MSKPLTYTGIGSRSTPEDMLLYMGDVGYSCALESWTLRSGHAGGADLAFEQGAIMGKGAMEIYLPWVGFNDAPRNDPRYVVPVLSQELLNIAKAHHPAWERCSQGAQKLHARNVCQILGSDLRSPADLVICWTKGGLGQGGTGQAIRVASTYGVPVYDLGSSVGVEALADFLRQY